MEPATALTVDPPATERRSVALDMASKQPFERIVEIHGPTVLRVCRAVVGETDADDAWSETFLSAMRAYDRLPPDANVEAWLVTIAHRRAIDAGRARSRRAVPTGAVTERADSSEHPDADTELIAALAALPDKQRWSVAYHYLGGLPYTDVAAILSGSAAAARRAAADGIAALRRAADAGELGGGRPTPTKSTSQKPRTSKEAS